MVSSGVRLVSHARTCEQVRWSSTPNYRGCRIPLASQSRIEAWRGKEHLLLDPSLVNMLAFGFLVGFKGDI